MPELPDVEVFKQYLDSTALHQPVTAVDIRSHQVIAAKSGAALQEAVVGRAFESTARHGKYLFVSLTDGLQLVMHFGMTGRLQYYKNEDKEPKYTQVRFDFDNDYHLAYEAPRKLGRLQLTPSRADFIEEKGLGPDVLAADFDLAAFKETLSGRRGMIKSTLMNQEIMAGLGNVYSDEILFQARINPRTRVNELDQASCKRLFETMKSVLQTVIDRQADPEQLPDSFLTPHRDEEEQCPRCDGTIERITVSGRSGYYCPKCQGAE